LRKDCEGSESIARERAPAVVAHADAPCHARRMTTTVFVSTRVARPAAEVYAFVADPRTLPRWAHGLGEEVEHVDGAWFVSTPAGRARVTFAPRNDLGVLDHVVDTPTGERVHVPLRVVPDGEDACEVVLMLRPGGMTPDEVARDAGLMQADLDRLRDLVEGESVPF
jgi:hypothetical protein